MEGMPCTFQGRCISKGCCVACEQQLANDLLGSRILQLASSTSQVYVLPVVAERQQLPSSSPTTCKIIRNIKLLQPLRTCKC